jgi:hypothetical protein
VQGRKKLVLRLELEVLFVICYVDLQKTVLVSAYLEMRVSKPVGLLSSLGIKGVWNGEWQLTLSNSNYG